MTTIDAERMADAVVDAIGIPIDGLVKRIEALTARVAQLEARPTMSYEGTYDQAKAYRSGEFVTHQGSVWHCAVDAPAGARPGQGSPLWRLACKRGADGRDAR